MNPLTTLQIPLALLLISGCLGVYAPAMAREKQQPTSLQCEENGVFKPCTGEKITGVDKPSQTQSFKAQSDESDTISEKKQKRKKKKTSKKPTSKKSKAHQSLAE
ncbi:MAG: hypothetical protein ACKO69_02605 [Limnohabitans sp.]